MGDAIRSIETTGEFREGSSEFAPRFSTVLPRIDALWVSSPQDSSLSGVECDSRQVMPNDLFVAVSGLRRDGDVFIPQAIQRGASIVVSEKDPGLDVDLGSIQWVKVLRSSRALGELASAVTGDPSHGLSVIGITGTNGKTSTSYLLRRIYEQAGKRVGLLGTVEVDLISRCVESQGTTPGVVQLNRHLSEIRSAGGEAAVLEVSSHALAQNRIDGVQFAAGVLTNLTGEHLDYHGTMDDYIAAKEQLFRRLSPGAKAVLNEGCEASSIMASSTRADVHWFGLTRASRSPMDSTQAKILRMNAGETRIGMSLAGETGFEDLSLRLLGRHNVENALAAAAVASALGFDPETIRAGLSDAPVIPGRLEPVGEAEPFSILVDYAHTDDALMNVLQAVRALNPARVRLVMGCGGDRDREKRPRMGRVAADLADVVYVTSDNPRSESPQVIVDEILAGISHESRAKVSVILDREEAIRAAVADARDGDLVLIAGKGHETDQTIGSKKFAFDDRKVADAALLERFALPVGGRV